MLNLSLVGRRVRILTYSMGDDWHLGEIVKAYKFKECESIAYEFLYESGHSLIIMADQIAAIELLDGKNKICNLNIVK